MELVITLRRLAPSLEAADVFFDAGVTLVERVLDDVRLPLQQRAPSRPPQPRNPSLCFTAPRAAEARTRALPPAAGRDHRVSTPAMTAGAAIPPGAQRAAPGLIIRRKRARRN